MRSFAGVMLAAAFACAAAPAAAAAQGGADKPAKADAAAAVVKVVGYVIKIETAPDGKSAVATLLVKGKKIPILVKDELTLKKFKIKKIRPDDEIKCQYKETEGANLSVSFLRTAGC